MKKGTVVYISNERISVVKAEVKRDVIKVEDCFHIINDEGTMVNGVIIDENALQTSLKQLVDKGIKEVYLIVDSAKISAKTAVVPKMKKQELLQFVKDELSLVEANGKDMIYDYSYLGADENIKKASKILCVGVERDFIKGYLDIFNEIGIKILAIDYSINVLISLVKEFCLYDKTYAISQVDGQNMINALFINDEYVLTNRTRLFSLKGTIDYQSEIFAAISQLKQFALSNNHELPMSDVYLFGLEKEEESIIFERIENILNIKANRLPKSKAIYIENSDQTFDISDYAYCIGYFKRK
jgi:Tfp pilus assembly PilM family ATPase